MLKFERVFTKFLLTLIEKPLFKLFDESDGYSLVAQSLYMRTGVLKLVMGVTKAQREPGYKYVHDLGVSIGKYYAYTPFH